MGKAKRAQQKRAEEKERAERALNEKRAERRETIKITVAVVAVLLVVAIVAASCSLIVLAVRGTGNYLRNKIGLKSEHYEVNNAMMSYFFHDTVNTTLTNMMSTYVNAYGIDASAAVQYGLIPDPNQPLKNQTQSNSSTTWYDYFMSETRNNVTSPNLLFLDEPASGLDPGTERNLMQSLRKMADSGKTVILVTHSTLQLKLCDKIVFMGKGGRLCFFGSHDEALAFFNVPDIVDIYNLITDQSEQWEANFAKTRNEQVKVRKSVETTVRAKEKMIRQLVVLSSRYLKLIVNDKQRLLLLLLQAPLLAVLISFVADGNQFEQYEMTKSLLFALSCSAFWIGMLNAIQEICKERSVLKREYMTGLSLDSYVLSKIVVLGVLCLVQSLLITGVFYLRVGVPSEGVALNSFIELLLTTFITAVSSTAMGLCVSSLFTNADRAMTVAPLLLMPQILFSGLIFKLSGAVEYISWFAVCRWSMEGYGTSADLNSLPLRLQQEGIMIQHELEDFFEHTVSHLLISWGILILFTVVFLLIARIVLTKINKE